MYVCVQFQRLKQGRLIPCACLVSGQLKIGASHSTDVADPIEDGRIFLRPFGIILLGRLKEPPNSLGLERACRDVGFMPTSCLQEAVGFSRR
jgi:hypothetical protein